MGIEGMGEFVSLWECRNGIDDRSITGHGILTAGILVESSSNALISRYS
jgi:hypothetical protein